VGCTLEEGGSEGRGFESRRVPAYTNRYTILGDTEDGEVREKGLLTSFSIDGEYPLIPSQSHENGF
jgi:hypothetical protein